MNGRCSFPQNSEGTGVDKSYIHQLIHQARESSNVPPSPMFWWLGNWLGYKMAAYVMYDHECQIQTKGELAGVGISRWPHWGENEEKGNCLKTLTHGANEKIQQKSIRSRFFFFSSWVLNCLPGNYGNLFALGPQAAYFSTCNNLTNRFTM